ncbi:hypothetical protein NQ036_03035 [Brevibacterium sp. 91QC2O2]|uniref:hypothetical protein n=1 Tax=Brevibacterium sp. 91QC2O2 TaxID=2968458 RepID=UPI00211C8BAF|nr:hypothetical protein [Brevibacterium sp. 91QC2O2]MCQ9367222.1 hypothetical protein [Brevibacterium sp. 91QC2O2]
MNRLRITSGVVAVAATIALAGCGGGGAGEAEQDSQPSQAAAQPAEASAPGADGGAAAGEDSAAAGQQGGGPVADGQEVTDKEYTFRLPADWTDAKTVPGASIPDGMKVYALKGTKDGIPNMNIAMTTTTSADTTIDDVEKDAISQIKDTGAKNPKEYDKFTVDGEQALHFSMESQSNGRSFLADQFYLLHGTNVYVLSFGNDPKVKQGDRNDMLVSVLNSWKWK